MNDLASEMMEIELAKTRLISENEQLEEMINDIREEMSATEEEIQTIDAQILFSNYETEERVNIYKEEREACEGPKMYESCDELEMQLAVDKNIEELRNEMLNNNNIIQKETFATLLETINAEYSKQVALQEKQERLYEQQLSNEKECGNCIKLRKRLTKISKRADEMEQLNMLISNDIDSIKE